MAAAHPVGLSNMSTAEMLRGLVVEKLTTAAQEIFATVERTVAAYEEQASGLRQEIDRQRRLLELLAQPEIKAEPTDDQFPVCQTGRGRRGPPEEEEQYKYEMNVEDSGSWSVYVEEEEGEEEEPAQVTSLDQQDLRDPGHQILSDEGKGAPLKLRVGLMQTSKTDSLLEDGLKSQLQDVRCPRGLQEPDFLDLLRSTFPQLTDASQNLRYLTLQTPTPEEIQRSVRPSGSSALFLRVQAANKSQKNTEELPLPQIQDKDTSDERIDENRPHASAVDEIPGDSLGFISEAHSTYCHQRDGLLVNSMFKNPRGEAGLKNHSCQHCDKSFTRSSYLKIHERGHLGEKPYSCDQCRKAFASPFDLKRHQRAHTGEKLYHCDHCGKACSTSGDLKIHRRIHTGEKPYSCDQCEKTFAAPSHLKTHKRVHTGEKPYSCVECGRAFATSSNLKSHRRIHTGEKPYSCDQCEKKYTIRANLKIHRRVHAREKPNGFEQ